MSDRYDAKAKEITDFITAPYIQDDFTSIGSKVREKISHALRTVAQEEYRRGVDDGIKAMAKEHAAVGHFIRNLADQMTQEKVNIVEARKPLDELVEAYAATLKALGGPGGE